MKAALSIYNIISFSLIIFIGVTFDAFDDATVKSLNKLLNNLIAGKVATLRS